MYVSTEAREVPREGTRDNQRTGTGGWPGFVRREFEACLAPERCAPRSQGRHSCSFSVRSTSLKRGHEADDLLAHRGWQPAAPDAASGTVRQPARSLRTEPALEALDLSQIAR
jgi:hypothetical protein